MIDLVLQAYREQPVGFDLNFLLIAGPAHHKDLLGSGDFGSVVNHREAAFLVGDQIVTVLADLRIDQLDQVGLVFAACIVLTDIENNHAFRHTNLWRCQTDSRCSIHGFGHVFDRLDRISVDIADVLGHIFQRGFRIGQNATHSHGGKPTTFAELAPCDSGRRKRRPVSARRVLRALFAASGGESGIDQSIPAGSTSMIVRVSSVVWDSRRARASVRVSCGAFLPLTRI